MTSRASATDIYTKPWAIMTPVRSQINFAMVISGLAATAALVTLVLLAWAVHELFLNPAQWPWQILLAATITTVFSYLLRMYAFKVSHLAAFRLETILRTDLAEHLAKVPLGYIQHMGSGGLTKVIMEDVKELHVFVADSTPLYARGYVSPILTFILLWFLDWRLALTATGIVIIGFITISMMMRNSTEMMLKYNTGRERIGSAVVEFVQAMPVVRTFDSGTTTFRRYQKALDDYLEIIVSWYKQAGISSRISVVVLGPFPTICAVLWLGGWLISRDSLTPSTWIAVLLICAGMAESIMPLMTLRHLVARCTMSIHRIRQVQNEPVLSTPATGTEKHPQSTDIRFSNVDFRYNEDAPLALKNINLYAPQGSITALVGPSGAGKSTIAKLIPRFWDVTAGSIQIGGVDVRDITPDTLMQHVSFVFQDTFLFADSIANNIRLGLPNVSMEDVIAAAQAAQVHDFITSLPNGYDTKAGERGLFLSGGQRQRITIARAILQNRPILVLDEATAFADPENEAALVTAIANLMRGKTILMVAHRLSTIMDADQILAFEQGELIEQGKHADLLEKHGLYARLWGSYEKAQNWALGISA